MVVVLDTGIDEMLELEGLAHDVVRGIQVARTRADFQISDRIELRIWLGDNAKLTRVCQHFEGYIAEHTLAVSISYGTISGEYEFQDSFTVDKSLITTGLKRAVVRKGDGAAGDPDSKSLQV